MSRLNLKQAQRRSLKRAPHSAEQMAPRPSIQRFSKGAYLLVGMCLGAFINALELPKSIVEFNENAPIAARHIYSWAYQSERWSGTFDTFPAGIVNMNELGISSPVNAALEIEVQDGNRLDGRIWWEGSCDIGLPYSGLLIKGEINLGGRSASVNVYDFLGGKTIEFFSGRLETDGLTMKLTRFPADSGLNGNVIVKNPAPAELEAWPELYCKSFLEMLQSLPK